MKISRKSIARLLTLLLVAIFLIQVGCASHYCAGIQGTGNHAVRNSRPVAYHHGF